MKQNWMQTATLALCVVLLALVLRQGQRIEQMEHRLDEEINDAKHGIWYKIDNVAADVRRGLAVTRLASSYDLTAIGVDKETRGLLSEASVTLRQWGEDTRAALLVRTGEETVEVLLAHRGNGVFAAPLTLPAGERGEVELDLAVTTGGVTSRESLSGWDDVSMLLPLQRSGVGGPAWKGCRDGILTLSPDLSMSLDDQNGQSVPVKDPVYRLYRNGELVLERPAATDPYEAKHGRYSYYLVAAPGTGLPETAQVTVPYAQEDNFLLTLSCVDEYGLTYEFAHSRWTVREDECMEGWAAVDDYPALTWPDEGA